jgi:hypothetical protein
VLVASRKDANFLTGKQIILVEHGAGQRYRRDAGGPDTPNLDVKLFLAPSQRVADNAEVLFPFAKRVAVGSPRVEYLASLPRIPLSVVLAWHWHMPGEPEGKPAWDRMQAACKQLAKSRDVLGHGHPRNKSRIGKDYTRLNIRQEWDWAMCVQQASCLVVDNSSIMWEACALDIPVVVVNAPFYRRDVEWGLRFWEYADIGPNVNAPGELEEAVRQVLEEDQWKDRRRQAAQFVYSQIEGSTKAAADEIMEVLQ